MCIYPERSVKGAVTITEEDLKVLEPDQFLNDNIIEFYMKYIYHNVLKETKDDFHFFNSFFYKSIKNYDRVKKWTEIDIFDKKYVFVPINEKYYFI